MQVGALLPEFLQVEVGTIRHRLFFALASFFHSRRSSHLCGWTPGDIDVFVASRTQLREAFRLYEDIVAIPLCLSMRERASFLYDPIEQHRRQVDSASDIDSEDSNDDTEHSDEQAPAPVAQLQTWLHVTSLLTRSVSQPRANWGTQLQSVQMFFTRPLGITALPCHANTACRSSATVGYARGDEKFKHYICTSSKLPRRKATVTTSQFAIGAASNRSHQIA